MPTSPQGIQWEHTDQATPALIPPMIDEMGLAENGKLESIIARDEARDYCLILLEETPHWYMGEIRELAAAFYFGYLSGLRKGLASRLC